jgi:5-formyltetrahydrofolate cyclo-ligase
LTISADGKAQIRRNALSSRRSLDRDYRAAASRAISQRVIHSHEFLASSTIACYLPADDEVDPSPVIARAWRAKKRVFAPVIDGCGGMAFRRLAPESRLEQNYFGLWEPRDGMPIAAHQIDLVITPLVAFDDNCNRIGMGGGYFDRCFSFLGHRQQWLRPKLVGVAFECQKVQKIQSNAWDIRLYRVITEGTRT